MLPAVKPIDGCSPQLIGGEKQRLLKVAKQFEAILVETMFKEAKLFGDTNSQAIGPQQDTVEKILAEQIVRGKGLGIADKLYQAVANRVIPDNQPQARIDN